MFRTMAKRTSEPPPLEPRDFRSPEEIDGAVSKLRRRIQELEKLDVRAAVLSHSGADEVARSNVRATILDVFGENSPEYREHQYIQIWAGPSFMNMSDQQIVYGTERGRVQVIEIVNGLIGRLQEKRADLTVGGKPSPMGYLQRLHVYPPTLSALRGLFLHR